MGTATTKQLRVALVNMPWARVDVPSIQCGLLKAIATAAGHECDVYYPNLELAAQLGLPAYESVSDLHSERLHLLGEWLFSYAAFGEITPDETYFDQHTEVEEVWLATTGRGRDRLIELRREILPRYLERLVEAEAWETYDAVGFSSTFLQNTASLALGRLLKERFPNLALIYGGANFDGDMGQEYARQLPWLDYVVVGEADLTFPRLLNVLASGVDEEISGVYRYGVPSARPFAGPPQIRTMDDLPIPDYTEYFAILDRIGRTAVLDGKQVKLPVELSRGCWWGEKHHCTFCGLNSGGMTFRAKTAGRAMRELEELLTTYPVTHVEAVDNILDMTYLSSLCTELSERHWDTSLFFEVKANLSREQLRSLRRAGIHRIQPGIESLSSEILRLMRKGATKTINIRLLKWARYYGISVSWNMLTGVPGEQDAHYDGQSDLIPALSHLQPPSGSTEIWLERFSPYFTDPSLGITDILPGGSYRHIYPEILDHGKIAYFFDYQAAPLATEPARVRLAEAVDAWRHSWQSEHPPTLIYQKFPGRLTILDGRTSPARKAVLHGWKAWAYEACGDTARSVAGVQRDAASAGHQVSDTQLSAFLDQCCRAMLMIADDGRYLSLALPSHPDI